MTKEKLEDLLLVSGYAKSPGNLYLARSKKKKKGIFRRYAGCISAAIIAGSALGTFYFLSENYGRIYDKVFGCYGQSLTLGVSSAIVAGDEEDSTIAAASGKDYRLLQNQTHAQMDYRQEIEKGSMEPEKQMLAVRQDEVISAKAGYRQPAGGHETDESHEKMVISTSNQMIEEYRRNSGVADEKVRDIKDFGTFGRDYPLKLEYAPVRSRRKKDEHGQERRR